VNTSPIEHGLRILSCRQREDGAIHIIHEWNKLVTMCTPLRDRSTFPHWPGEGRTVHMQSRSHQHNGPVMSRIHGLDHLRGLAALGIMIYHYSIWAHGPFGAGSILGRIGIYGVPVFYVLSGITLYTVYFERMGPTRDDLAQFFKRRFLRIFPLLWLVTGAAIVLSGKAPDLVDVALNVTGLFGFFSWDRTFSAGIWSIGNELVFYAMFPLIVLLIRSSRFMLGILTFIMLMLYILFAFHLLDASTPLVDQWKLYTNPLNQAFFFLGGVLVGHVLQAAKLGHWLIMAMLMASSVFFLFHQASGDLIVLVTGMNRVYFTLWSFFMSICFYKASFQLPAAIHRPLTLLGESSYSIYLLHPLVWNMMAIAGGILSNEGLVVASGTRIVASFMITLVISYVVHRYFETYFMNLGRGPGRAGA
jgi:peptidoglycan/LPS O-acetylase OafA/YrhL